MAQDTNTQQLVKLTNIRNDVVVAGRGKLRAVLKVSSINLMLKSQKEQEGIIFEYQSFLNSLDFPIQVYVNSRLLNIEDYIKSIEEKMQQQDQQLLQMQTAEYVKFVRGFVENTNIISTDFYVVVPFSTVDTATDQGGAVERLKTLFGQGSELSTMDSEKFFSIRGQLLQRVDFVSAGLHRIGIGTQMLTTEELISLFWNLYNSKDLRKRNLIKPLFE